MRNIFTKPLSALLFSCLIFSGIASFAQQTVSLSDSTAKASGITPKGNLWGYAFGDFYYKSHSDSLNRGGANQYTNIAKNRNGFQLRRVYLGYDYNISQRFSAEVLLAAEDNVTTSPNTGTQAATTSGDLLNSNKFTFYLKLINLRWKNIWRGTDFIIGQIATPAFPLLTEKIWGYRSVERTVSDIRRTLSFDLGASLQGTFDPDTQNFGYDLMVGNGQGAKPAVNAFKWFYGDVYAKFLQKRLIFDLYADYEGFANATKVGTVQFPAQSRQMIKGYVAYTTPQITIGVEAFTNLNKGGALTTTNDAAKTQQYVDVHSIAISTYIRGVINSKLGYFARYDNYNPNTSFNTNVTYSKPLIAQYDSNVKEQFITTGLDFTPEKNMHFMPNIWYDRYQGQQANLTGKAKTDFDLVYRLTFFFTFGK